LNRIDAHDFMTVARKATSRNRPYISQAKDADSQSELLTILVRQLASSFDPESSISMNSLPLSLRFLLALSSERWAALV